MTGYFQSKITGSVSIPATRSKSLRYLNVFTVPPNIPVPKWASPSANASSSGSVAGSGSSPSLDGGRRFTLQSRSESSNELPGNRRGASVLLVEDNPADAVLVRKALEEHGIEGQLTVF